MKRYYLIPFETDDKKLEYEFQPKYIDLDIFKTSALGMQPEITISDGEKQFKQKFYIMMLVGKTAADFEEIEGKSDVIPLNKDTELSVLEKLGIDISGIKDTTKYAEKDQAVTMWLSGEKSILSEKL